MNTKTKINKFKFFISINKNILGFYVSMHNIVIMKVSYCL